MAKKRAQPKEKPSFETVKKGLRATDLLKVEVCNPLKEQLEKIDVCSPHIGPIVCTPDIECIPSRLCSPYIICRPDWECIPTSVCRPWIYCSPDIFCGPRIGCSPKIFEIQEDYRRYREKAGSQTMAEELTPEMKEMTEELRKIRAEIEDLKKKIK